jgi:hypothetical protein
MRLELIGGVVIAGAGVVYASLGYAAGWSCEHAPSPTLCVTSTFPDVVAFALIVIRPVRVRGLLGTNSRLPECPIQSPIQPLVLTKT